MALNPSNSSNFEHLVLKGLSNIAALAEIAVLQYLVT